MVRVITMMLQLTWLWYLFGVASPPLLESQVPQQGLTECIKLIAILVIQYNHSLPAGCFSSRRVWNYFLEFAI